MVGCDESYAPSTKNQVLLRGSCSHPIHSPQIERCGVRISNRQVHPGLIPLEEVYTHQLIDVGLPHHARQRSAHVFGRHSTQLTNEQLILRTITTFHANVGLEKMMHHTSRFMLNSPQRSETPRCRLPEAAPPPRPEVCAGTPRHSHPPSSS
jgi:hypothetical protein